MGVFLFCQLLGQAGKVPRREKLKLQHTADAPFADADLPSQGLPQADFHLPVAAVPPGAFLLGGFLREA